MSEAVHVLLSWHYTSISREDEYFPLYGRVVNKQEPTGNKAVAPRCSTIATERAWVWKYAAEYGLTKAARYFSKLLDNQIISEKAYVRPRPWYIVAFAKPQLLHHKLRRLKSSNLNFTNNKTKLCW